MSSEHPDINYSTAAVNGIELHYAHAGKGPLVIFLHGFPSSTMPSAARLPDANQDLTRRQGTHGGIRPAGPPTLRTTRRELVASFDYDVADPQRSRQPSGSRRRHAEIPSLVCAHCFPFTPGRWSAY